MKYSREIKSTAVRKVLEDGMEVNEVSKEMGIKKCSIYLWIREYENIGSLALMSVKDMTPDERAYVMGKRCSYSYPDVPSAVFLEY